MKDYTKGICFEENEDPPKQGGGTGVPEKTK